MRDWFAIVSSTEDYPVQAAGDSPAWVHVAVARIDKSLFAPPNAILGDAVANPYRVGYALGLMKWGKASLDIKTPPEVRNAIKGVRLARRARKEMIRMCQDFLINVQIIAKRNGRLEIAGAREIKMANSLARKYSGRDESDFHRGLSDGLRGLGRGAPGDRSTDATDVYLLLVIWWRFVARLSSVTQLHNLAVRCLGPARAGEKKRIEKLCQRIGLTFRKRGRPKKIRHLPPRADGI